jgi:propionyl-CoA carboxylase alpha chain
MLNFDEAVWIGESPNQSYLLGDKIIEVAKSLGWMLFIGYGF